MTTPDPWQDRLALTALAAQACRALDRLDLALLRACYWPEATEDRGFVGGQAQEVAAYLIERLRPLAMTHHQLGQSVIALDGDRAQGEHYVTVHYRMGGERLMVMLGRYLDVYARRDGEWRILERREIVDLQRIVPAADGQAAQPVGQHRGTRGRDDPSHDLFGAENTGRFA